MGQWHITGSSSASAGAPATHGAAPDVQMFRAGCMAQADPGSSDWPRTMYWLPAEGKVAFDCAVIAPEDTSNFAGVLFCFQYVNDAGQKESHAPSGMVPLSDFEDDGSGNLVAYGKVMIDAKYMPAVPEQWTAVASSVNADDVVNVGEDGLPTGPTVELSTIGSELPPQCTDPVVSVVSNAKLPDGSYVVRATWVEAPNRSTGVRYRMYAGDVLLGEATVNQRVAPTAHATIGGRPFQTLGTYVLSGARAPLYVEIALANANGVAIADAVQWEMGGKSVVADNAALGYAGSWALDTAGYYGPNAHYTSAPTAYARWWSDFDAMAVKQAHVKMEWSDVAAENRRDYAIRRRLCDPATMLPYAGESYEKNGTIGEARPYEAQSEWPIPPTWQLWQYEFRARNWQGDENTVSPPSTFVLVPGHNALDLAFASAGSLGGALYKDANGKLAVKTDAGYFGIGSNGELTMNGIPLDKALAGTFDATLFESAAGKFKLKLSDQFKSTGNKLELNNLYVGNATGMPAGVFVYKYNTMTLLNDLVGWIGHNGSIVGGWVKEFYVGGTSPANAKVYVDANGNAVFTGTILASTIGTGGLTCLLNSVTTTIGNVSDPAMGIVGLSVADGSIAKNNAAITKDGLYVNKDIVGPFTNSIVELVRAPNGSGIFVLRYGASGSSFFTASYDGTDGFADVLHQYRVNGLAVVRARSSTNPSTLADVISILKYHGLCA